MGRLSAADELTRAVEAGIRARRQSERQVSRTVRPLPPWTLRPLGHLGATLVELEGRIRVRHEGGIRDHAVEPTVEPDDEVEEASRVAVGEPEPDSALLVLDVELALDGALADLLRTELSRGGRVHVVLVLPRLGWSSDAALVALHGRRRACAPKQRLTELAWLAGPGPTQITVSVRKQGWWRRPLRGAEPQSLSPAAPTPEGTVR